MFRPSMALGAAVAIAGGLLILVSAVLQITVLDDTASSDLGIENGRIIASYVLSGVGTAGGFVLAAGVVIGLVAFFAPEPGA
jgi:hypothetical protein